MSTEGKLNKPAMPVGVDIIEISRIEQAVARWKDSFLERIYTESELRSCRKYSAGLAGRFAAKEAVIKVLGGSEGMTWHDIEITTGDKGMPAVILHGGARRRADMLGLGSLSISISHTRKYAVAFSVGNAA